MRSIAAIVALTSLASVAGAYEVDTHAMISSHAYNRSALATQALLLRVGLDRFDDSSPASKPFSVSDFVGYGVVDDGYFDPLPSEWNGVGLSLTMREVRPYDWHNMFSGPGEDYRNTGKEKLRTKGWFMRGAIREDDLTAKSYEESERPDNDPLEILRPLQHFFDPVNDRPLSVGVACNLLPTVNYPCTRSVDWAMGRNGVTSEMDAPVDASRVNHFSWADARSAMWCALTQNAGDYSSPGFGSKNSAERRVCWASVVKTLGHVAHLLQDTSQPQHVRNDRHNPNTSSLIGTTRERRMFEVWTNYRVTKGEISASQREVGEFRKFFQDSESEVSPVSTGLNYPIPRFAEPQHYFTTRQMEVGIDASSLRKRRGLADFANRNFFSEGTVLSADFPLPPSDPDSAEYSLKTIALLRRTGFGELREEHLSISLFDSLKGAYVDQTLLDFGNVLPLANVSLWEEYVPNNVKLKASVISLDQYSAHADVLIPRAIAYSAGLIDYFFRGKLEITPPLDGLFSVIDHGTPHTVNTNGYPIRSDDSKVFGFTRMRLRVRNATEVVNESGTTLPIPRDMLSTTASAAPLQGDPTLVAVARYHRNSCYKPDLSGEKRIAFDGAITEAAGCGAAGTRTPFQEISVSRPVASNAAALNGAGQDLVFDFASQPIPVNATDLAIQVVYRGPLGLEGDAIAVGAFDIREPTYLTHWNNSDYAACNGAWAAHGATPPGCIVEGGGAQRAIFTTRLCIGTQMVFEHLENPHGSLGTGSFVRLAALLDDKQKPTRSRSIVHNLSSAEIRNRTIVGQVRQSAKEQVTAQAPFVSEPMWKKRGFVGSSRPLPYYQINGADLQPVSDTGPMDVGALANPISVAAAPDSGNIVFPDVALSSMACTVQDGKAVFADEVAYEPGRPH